MSVEDEFTDVLQNIEFAIVATYREHPDLSDYGVMSALDALIDVYAAERIGRAPRSFGLTQVERRLMHEMQAMCEWRLGRSAAPIDDPSKIPPPGPKPITREDMIRCLKRILKSVKLWNKEGGTQGYLNFIVEYVM